MTRSASSPSGDDNSATFAVDVETIEGAVVGVSAPNASGDAGGDPRTGNSVVDVSVPASAAPGLAAKAANGKVALVLDSREH